MKTSYTYITLLCLFIFIGCNDDFLEKYPDDKINDQNFWKTASDLRLYNNALYEKAFELSLRYNIDNQSDNQGPTTRQNFIWNEYPIPTSGGGWAKSDWLWIRRCNYFMQRYHQVQDDQTAINTYVGEVLFFKSHWYFEKVRKFGDVPWLVTDLTDTSKELYAPKDSRGVVVDSINLCLDKAVSFLPEETKDGRLTQYAALALKSRVNLYEGTFRKYHGLDGSDKYLRLAANAAKAIIDSGLFELYTTGNPEEDYSKFFILKNLSGVSEAIFYTEYLADTKMHNRSREVRESNSGMTKDFVESFLCIDGRPITGNSLYLGDDNYIDEFENRDPRMKQIIYAGDRPLRITSTGDVEYEPVPTFTNQTYTGYRIFKFYSQYDEDNEYNRCTLDDCHFRYAEVLLNYAEAMAELGECDQAVLNLSINKLRDRVGMPRLSINPVADPNPVDYGYSISNLLYEIRRERRIELAVEGFRWDDIIRWKAGKLVNNPKTYLGARDPETDTYKVLYSGYTRQWNDRLYLYPIPSEELQLNPNLLPQNPGW